MLVKISEADKGRKVMARIKNDNTGKVEVRIGIFLGFDDNYRLPLIKYEDFKTPRYAKVEWLTWKD